MFAPPFPCRFDGAVTCPEPIAIAPARRTLELFHNERRHRNVNMLPCLLRVEPQLAITQAIGRASDGVGNAEACVAEEENQASRSACAIPARPAGGNLLLCGCQDRAHLLRLEGQRGIRPDVRLAQSGRWILFKVSVAQREFEKRADPLELPEIRQAALAFPCGAKPRECV